jgi:hypothetical protein
MTTAVDATSEAQTLTATEITLVDRNGKPRIRLGVDDDGTAAVKFFDRDEKLRMALYLKEPGLNDEDCLTETGSDNDSGLLVVGRRSGASVALGITEDGLFGKRPRLEIVEGTGWGKKRHRFPPRPPNVND